MPIEKSYVILGTEAIDVLVSSHTSQGQFSILTELAPPGGGPPPHIHTLEDEFLMPLFGTFEKFDGSSWTPLPAEGFYTPRGTLHTWRNAGTEPAKLFMLNTGSSFDVFLERLVGLKMPDDLQRLVSISAEHGISYVFPPAEDRSSAPA